MAQRTWLSKTHIQGKGATISRWRGERQRWTKPIPEGAGFSAFGRLTRTKNFTDAEVREQSGSVAPEDIVDAPVAINMICPAQLLRYADLVQLLIVLAASVSGCTHCPPL